VPSLSQAAQYKNATGLIKLQNQLACTATPAWKAILWLPGFLDSTI